MFKVEFLRFIKNPMNIVFSLIFPVALMILFGELFDAKEFQSNFISIIYLSTVSITIIPISINVCLDKIERRTKHYAIIEGATTKYIISLFFTNFIIGELTVILLILIGNLGYNVEVADSNIAMLIFGPVLSFILGFSIGIIFGKYTKSFGMALPLAMFTFFIVLFISGMTVPLQVLAPKYFFYIQVLTPQGIMIMLYNHLASLATTMPPGIPLPDPLAASILDTTQLAVAGTMLGVYSTTLIGLTSYIIFKAKII